MSEPVIFCTLFNQIYLPQGIALYRSLERTAKDGFLLYVLCMDRQTAAVLEGFAFPSLRVIRLEDIETEAMKVFRAHRSVGEYCWTCTSPLLLHVLDQCDPGTVVTYVDADIAFFSDPSAMMKELGSGSIYIHEHDFAPRYAALEAVSGRFNVGVSSFRNDVEGRACLELWKSQCFDECVMDFDAGKCGDQNYLDEWPKLYPSLVISTNPGVGLGPWNIESRKICESGSHLVVDDRPAVFYHYHSLKLLKPNWEIKPIWLSGWFEIPAAAESAFYRPYARELWRAVADMERNGFPIRETMSIVPDKFEDMPFQQTVMSVGKLIVPSFLRGRIFRLLSSDARRRAGRHSDS
jgi:hypothetical protein